MKKKGNPGQLTLRFDSVGGASGDLILSSLVALGVDPSKIHRGLSSLSAGSFKLQVKTVSEHGFAGKQLSVKIKHSHHHHRHLDDILSMIRKSRLSPWVKNLSTQVFRKLAAAEAKVHGTTPDKIHFHEVGAVDSIVDIVGSCLALEILGVNAVTVNALPLGHGTVECEHGTLPLPAPAVVELLKKHPVIQVDEPFETVTPTGAALLMTWKEFLPAKPSASLAILKTGLGFGHHRFKNRSNSLRATLLENIDADQDKALRADASGVALGAKTDECLVLECNIDDTIPELIGSLCQNLMKKGALDVFTTPVQMKKQRPGTLLTVLCKPADRDRLVKMIFAESTTFGIREHLTRRTILQRRHITVMTPYGKVRVKIGSLNGRDITASPEHDDCVKCAAKHNVPVRRVYELALRARRA